MDGALRSPASWFRLIPVNQGLHLFIYLTETDCHGGYMNSRCHFTSEICMVLSTRYTSSLEEDLVDCCERGLLGTDLAIIGLGLSDVYKCMDA